MSHIAYAEPYIVLKTYQREADGPVEIRYQVIGPGDPTCGSRALTGDLSNADAACRTYWAIHSAYQHSRRDRPLVFDTRNGCWYDSIEMMSREEWLKNLEENRKVVKVELTN